MAEVIYGDGANRRAKEMAETLLEIFHSQDKVSLSVLGFLFLPPDLPGLGVASFVCPSGGRRVEHGRWGELWIY